MMEAMDLWYTENHTEHVKFSVRVNKQLCSRQSEFQRIDMFETKEFGNMLTLDGYVMCTQIDEFIYHEMIVHTPMAVHPNVERVLVIGGGDGGALRELAKYDSIKQLDLVEIDEEVINACKEFLPETACGFSDKRVTVYIQDGLKYIRTCENTYDLIIVDSTDPFGPGEGLFTKEFYGNCYKALKEDGIMVNQHESPFYENDARAMQRAHKRITESFAICRVYSAHIPTYPSGHWLFGFASKKYHPVKDLKAMNWKALNINCRYYNCNLHRGSFAMPNYVEELLKNVEAEEEIMETKKQYR